MGAVDTASPKPIKLSLNRGMIRAWNPDTRMTTEHPAWRGYLVGWAYETNAEHPDPNFRKPELVISLHDGEREALLAMRLESNAFRQFACAIENYNPRQPLTVRPWIGKNAKGEPITGGVNLYHGPLQVQPRYTKKQPNGLPMITERQNPATMAMEKVGGEEQMLFLRNIIENFLSRSIEEAVGMQAWLPEPEPVTPKVPSARLLAQPAPVAALPPAAESEGAGNAPKHEAGTDEDDLPF